jgi:hypothetical protein
MRSIFHLPPLVCTYAALPWRLVPNALSVLVSTLVDPSPFSSITAMLQSLLNL